MAHANMTPSLSLRTVGPQRPRIAALVVRVVRVSTGWLTLLRTRKQLHELDDHMLNDIGITRAQAHKEARRPFWHG